jgi:hypothetical protein
VWEEEGVGRGDGISGNVCETMKERWEWYVWNGGERKKRFPWGRKTTESVVESVRQIALLSTPLELEALE